MAVREFAHPNIDERKARVWKPASSRLLRAIRSGGQAGTAPTPMAAPYMIN